jgi:hypothetical protein
MANTTFSACAAAACAAVAAIGASRGLWVVAGVWGALTLGFVARAGERYWRGER